MDKSEVAVREIFSLYDKWGGDKYIGENVTQLQHAQQSHINNTKFPTDPKTIYLKGHLVGLENNLAHMTENGVTLGTVDHDKVGEEFLQSLGFPKDVTQFVRGHVQAKRYLVFKDPKYHDKLTDASKGTLIHQGGPMVAEEAQKFESLSNFGAILKMRQWDEAAKDVNIPVVDNQKFVNIIKNILNR